ncbi:hypothetical protein [Streptomyces incarnatus]|uniref:hypothetical protein n=1 Tax=Streptomyces incarnatus TaxID=665007 RepID=UPI000A918DC4|nr:hypothetical protein [Streptomyces incarnatus]
MSREPVTARELYARLLDHTGAGAYDAVAAPWTARAGAAYRERLTALAQLLAGPLPEKGDPRRARLSAELWELYALSRVADALLLSFQPPGHDHWAGPGLSRERYLALFTGLGMTPVGQTSVFDPFLHEIVEAEQAADPAEPIRVTGVVWPGLWLGGGVLFVRAGVRVRAGLRHAERGVADRSPLYWTFRRRHRPTVDPSMGWGSASQWRTEFRVDVRTTAGDRLNVLGDTHIDAVEAGGAEALLTPAERRDLLRHRCLLRTPERADALAARPGWAADLFPYGWR